VIESTLEEGGVREVRDSLLSTERTQHSTHAWVCPVVEGGEEVVLNLVVESAGEVRHEAVGQAEVVGHADLVNSPVLLDSRLLAHTTTPLVAR
jgi:hypothetical protein